MAFLFRRAQHPPPSASATHPPPPPPPPPPPQAPLSNRPMQSALSAYISVSGNNLDDNTVSGSSDQVVQKGTLITVAKSIRQCVSGMSRWDLSDLTLGLYKIATRHALEGISDTIDGCIVSDNQELEEILYWLDWAWASYLANEKAITEYLHIEEQQLKKHVKTSAILKPAYFVAIDKSKKCVVLSIRGTYAATDVLTDLQPHSEKFEGGYAHSGILSAARWILENENDHLQILLSENLGYKLVITGHSLGAGASCLLSYLLHESVGCGNKAISSRLGISSSLIECWGFGCPPCVNKQLCENVTFIKNIVLQDDIVARASVAALEDLRAEILQTNWADVLEDGGIAKKMLGLVNNTNAALGNVEQALGYVQGTFYQQVIDSLKATVARNRGGPPVYNGTPGQYGSLWHYGPPGHFVPPGNGGPPQHFFGPPGNGGPPQHFFGPPGNGGLPMQYGHPGNGGLPMQYSHPVQYSFDGSSGYQGPQNPTGWLSFGASIMNSYLNTPGNPCMTNVVAGRECMEGGRLFVPGILFHVKRSHLETINADRLRSAEGASARKVDAGSCSSNETTGSAPIPMRHFVIRGWDPKGRFMKIVLSKSLLSDHSLGSYKDGIKDAIRWNMDTKYA